MSPRRIGTAATLTILSCLVAVGGARPVWADSPGSPPEVLTGDVSTAARAGTLRNAAHELTGIALVPGDVAPLGAFLRSLDEDYR